MVERRPRTESLSQWRKTVQADLDEDVEDRGRTVSIANVGSLSGKVKVKGGQKKKWSDITLDVRDGMMYLYEDENQLRKKTPFDTIALAGHQVAEISKVHLGFVVFKDSKKDGLLFTAGSSEEVKQWLVRIREACLFGSTAVFGVPLPVVVRKSSDKRVPDIMVATFKALYNGNHLDAEGIFRLSGSASKVAALQELFDSGSANIPLQTDVHDITGVVKKFLRELPEPLVTFSLYDTFVHAFSDDGDAMLLNLSRAVLKLPSAHRTTLAFLMSFLSDVAAHEAKTKMGFHNLAVVFAPTILKMKGVEDFSNMDSTLKVTEFLIRYAKDIFTEEMLSETGGKEGFKASTTDIVTADEKKAVDSHLQSPAVGDANKLLVRLSQEVRDKKGKVTGTEERVVVVGKWRVYLFLKGGRFQTSFHFLDLKEIFSTSPQDLRLTFTTGLLSFKPMSNPNAIDDVIHAIRFFYEASFPDAPTTSRFAVELKPPSRLRRINQEVTPCYGYANAFRGCCNHSGLPLSTNMEYVLTTINEIFANNATKTFNLIECHPLDLTDRLPTPEFGCLMGALHWNSWFTTLAVDNISVKEAGCNTLFEVFAHNKTISSLVLKNCGVSPASLAVFAQSIAKNAKPALQELDLSHNDVGDKGVASLTTVLESGKLKLRALNLNNTRLSKKGVVVLATTLAKSQLTLKTLGLAETKMEHAVGAVIQFANAAALTKLDLSGSSLSAADLKPLTACEILDVSGIHIKPKEAKLWCAFLNGSKRLQRANLANTALRPELLPEIDKLLLRCSHLNLADNELGDQGIAVLGRILSENSRLRNLNLDSCWGKKSAARDEALLRFREIVTKCQLQKLSLKGGRFPLVDDACLIALCVSFSTISSLDISDHRAGDTLMQVLCQVVQQNRNLETLVIDGNSFSHDAYRTFYLALQRNKTLRHLPFPYQDFKLLSEKGAADAISIMSKIQDAMAEKSAPNEQQEADEDEVQPDEEDVPL